MIDGSETSYRSTTTRCQSIFRLPHTLFQVILASGVLLTGDARATGDNYSVAYALDVGGSIDTGIVTCSYDKPCYGGSKLHRISLAIYASYDRKSITLYSLFGPNVGCCYFRDGGISEQVNADGKSHYIGIFEGKSRRGNELVLNTKIGTLALVVVP